MSDKTKSKGFNSIEILKEIIKEGSFTKPTRSIPLVCKPKPQTPQNTPPQKPTNSSSNAGGRSKK